MGAVLELPNLMSRMVDIGIIQKGVEDPALIGSGSQQTQLNFILKTGGLMVLVALTSVVFSVSAGNLASRISAGLARDLREKIFEKVEHFSLADIDRFSISSLTIRSTNDIAQVQQTTFMLFRLALVAPFTAIGALFMAIRTDVGLSWIVAVALPILAAVIGSIAIYAMPLFRKQQKKNDYVNLVAREGLTGVRVIRAFNRMSTHGEKFNQANIDLTDISKKVNSIMVILMPIMAIIIQVVYVATIWFGSHRIGAGVLSIGSLMAYLQYAMHLMMSLMMTSFVLMMYPRASVSAERINAVITAESLMKDGFEEFTGPIETIELKEAAFAFPCAEENAVEGLSFTLKRGETTAIIGSTGSGKSTILNLILRLYDATEGEVLLNGRNIKDFQAATVRSRVGYTPQKALLFSGTVAENIRVGKENASDEEVWEALETAQAKSFIEESSEKLDLKVAQGGTNFSGGQKQRLAIARALISKPDLFLFDDTFSALDASTERRLRDALKPYAEHSITLVVSQRISSIVGLDQIIVLDQGRIVGLGTHQELIANNTVYQEIARSQNYEKEQK